MSTEEPIPLSSCRSVATAGALPIFSVSVLRVCSLCSQVSESSDRRPITLKQGMGNSRVR